MNDASNQCRAYEHQRLSTVWSSLGDDLLRYINRSPETRAAGASLGNRLKAATTPELLCLLIYRIAHWLYVNHWLRAAAALDWMNVIVHKTRITSQSCIGPGFHLPHPAGVTFHGRAGRDLTLYSLAICCPREDSLYGPAETGPQLGDRVTVAAHAIVLGPVRVGDDTKLALATYLCKDSPAAVLVISNLFHQSRRPLVAQAQADCLSAAEVSEERR